MTAGYAAFLLAGPKARDVLVAAGARDLSAERPTETEIGYAPAAIPGLRVVAYGKNLTDADIMLSTIETTFAATAAS